MKIGPITRAQNKIFKVKIAAFIQGVTHVQKGLSIPEDPRPILSIQVVEAGIDLGSGFGAIMEAGKHEMVPLFHGFNTYV